MPFLPKNDILLVCIVLVISMFDTVRKILAHLNSFFCKVAHGVFSQFATLFPVTAISAFFGGNSLRFLLFLTSGQSMSAIILLVITILSKFAVPPSQRPVEAISEYFLNAAIWTMFGFLGWVLCAYLVYPVPQLHRWRLERHISEITTWNRKIESCAKTCWINLLMEISLIRTCPIYQTLISILSVRLSHVILYFFRPYLVHVQRAPTNPQMNWVLVSNISPLCLPKKTSLLLDHCRWDNFFESSGMRHWVCLHIIIFRKYVLGTTILWIGTLLVVSNFANVRSSSDDPTLKSLFSTILVYVFRPWELLSTHY